MGVPVKTRVLVHCPAHSASVRVAITNIAVIRTYVTQSSSELVRAGAAELRSPPMARADAAIVAGIWPACRKRSGTVWACVRMSAGAAVVGRTPGNETFTVATWIVLAPGFYILTPVPRERGLAAAPEGVPGDDTGPAMFAGVGLAWIIICIIPVRILRVGP